MKYIILLFISIQLFASDYKYCYNLARFYVSPLKAKEYAIAITNKAKKYKIPARYIARHCFVETRFDQWEVSKSYAYGPWQIRPVHWNHLTKIVDNGKVWKKVKRGQIDDIDNVYYNINYSCEMSCMIISYFYKKYDSYDLAYLAFLYGDNHAVFKKYKKKPWKVIWNEEYVRIVLDEKYASNFIYKMYGYNLIDK